MYFKSTVQNRFSKKRYRVTGSAAGFYQLQGVSAEDRFTGEKITEPGLFLKLFYKVVEPVTIGRLWREDN
jgi:hypothetical protein